MAQTARVLQVMIASPGDVNRDRKAIKDTIVAWNTKHRKPLNVILDPIMWETHSAPDLSDRPQAVINRQLLMDCDILIGLFWSRLGTPTGAALSGTVEEIEEALKLGKRVLLYFSQAPVPIDVNIDQLQKLREVQADFKRRGLVSTYKSTAHLKSDLDNHLLATVRELLQDLKKEGSQIGADIKPQSLSMGQLAPFRMPVPVLPEYFYGRDDQLATIHQLLTTRRGLKAIHLFGLGGLGKTTMAAGYANRYGSAFTHHIWVDMESDISLPTKTFLERVGLYHTGMKAEEIRYAFRTWLSENDNWLLVLNGATDETKPVDLLPENFRGTVIVTSRDRSYYTEGELFEVQEISEDASVQYLLDATGHSNREGARRLAIRLAGYPLMLEIAAAYLKEEWARESEKHDSFDHYIELLDLNPMERMESEDRFSRYPHSLSAVFSLSLSKVKEHSSRQSLERAAFLAPTGINRYWLVEQWVNNKVRGWHCISKPKDLPERERRFLSPLFQTALLRREGARSASIHPLLQEWLLARMQSEDKRTRLTQVAAILSDKAEFSDDDLSTWVPFQKMLPHAERVVSAMKYPHLAIRERCALSYVLGQYWYTMGDMHQALSCSRDARLAAERVEGSDSNAVANYIDLEAAALSGIGEHQAAIDLFLRALHIKERVLGPGHQSVAITLNNLAIAYRGLGESHTAIDLHQRALRIREMKRPQNDLDVAATLNNLAGVYSDLGDTSKAVELARRALEMYTSKFGPDHPDVAMVMCNLAARYDDLGDLRQAISLYTRALQIRESKLGLDHPDVASTLNNLAISILELGDLAKTIDLLKRACQIRETRLGQNHQDYAGTLNNLALAYADLGDLSQAFELCVRSLDILENRLPPDHSVVALTLTNFGATLAALGQESEAKTAFARAIDILRKRFGTSHLSSIECRAEYAWARWVLGERVESAEDLTREYDALRDRLGAAHPLVGKTSGRLSQIFEALGDSLSAAEMQERSVESFLSSLGPEAPKTQQALRRLEELRRLS